jgi:hypothetical protein
MAKFQDLLPTGKKNPRATSVTANRRKADDEMPTDLAAPGETEAVENTEVPEDAVEIDGKIYTTVEGDLLVVPDEPLIVEGLDEPIHQVEVSLVSEEEVAPTKADPADLATEPSGESKHAEEDEAGEDLYESMAAFDDPSTHSAFFKGGTEANPTWYLTFNGDLKAHVAFSDQASDDKFKEFFASDNFPAKVKDTARSLGWGKVLSSLKAKIYSAKNVKAMPEKIDMAALREEVRTEIKNNIGLAYSAMVSSLRTNPIAATLFEAVRASGMEAPEVFTASVIQASAGEFVNSLLDTVDEVAGMSKQVQGEFKNLIARTIVPVESRPSYTPDKAFMAKLQENSVPVAPVASTDAPKTSTRRFAGILS